MDITSVHCLRDLTMTMLCAFTSPIETNFYATDAPQYFRHAKFSYAELYAAANHIYYVPEVGPVVTKKPKYKIPLPEAQKQVVEALEKPQKKKIVKESVVMASFVPAKPVGLMNLVKKSIEKPSTLFVKADGSENTSCLQKDDRLWSAMGKIRKYYGKPLIIESAYRSPEYNAALRKKSKRVAKHSQHMNCKAIDFRIAGVSMSALRKYVRSLPEIGGVGLYDNWVHIDTRSSKINW